MPDEQFHVYIDANSLCWFNFIIFFKGSVGWGSGEVHTRAGQSIVLLYALHHVLHLSRDECVLALLMLIRCVTLHAAAVSGFTCSECGLRLLLCGQLHQRSSPVPKGGGCVGVCFSFTSSFSFFWAPSSRIQLLALGGPLHALLLFCEFSARLVT